MLRFVVRRLLQMVGVLLVLSLLVFVWLRSLPGGPVSALLGERQTEALGAGCSRLAAKPISPCGPNSPAAWPPGRSISLTLPGAAS